MLKFLLTNKQDGQPVIGFGITEENVKRLMAGQPILVDLREMGLDAKITIFYGETDNDVYQQIHDMIGETTIVHRDAPDEQDVSENEKTALKKAGYRVKEGKHGWSPSLRGMALIRGWTKTEGKAWWICWNDFQRKGGDI